MMTDIGQTEFNTITGDGGSNQCCYKMKEGQKNQLLQNLLTILYSHLIRVLVNSCLIPNSGVAYHSDKIIHVQACPCDTSYGICQISQN